MILIGLVILGTGTSHAQKTEIRVDGNQIFKTIGYFASDQFMGRRTGSPELHRLQDWIVEQYRNLGLEPAGEDGSYFQTVPITRDFANTYGIPELVIGGREFYSRYDDFDIDIRSTADLKVSEDIIFAGYGISAPAKGFDEYAGMDVKDRVVFVLKGNPNDFTPPSLRLSEYKPEDVPKDSLKNWDSESTDSSKIMTAYEKGAAAIILYDPEGGGPDPFRRYRQSLEKSPFTRDFLVVSDVNEEVFNWLFWQDPQMSERGFRTWVDAVRQDLKLGRSRSFDTKMEAEITGYSRVMLKGKKFGENTGRNIIARINGTDPALKDQYVIMGGHLDHVGVTAGQIYNGAEDNASGSAVVFELAKLMKKSGIRLKRTVIFCLWSGEELGLFGSEYWVAHPTGDVSMDHVVGYFNMDMVGIGTEIGAPGALNFPTIWDVIKQNQNEDIMAVVKPDTGELGGSDQSPFMELGIESLALMTEARGGHPDYHDTGDDPYKMNPEILRKTGQFVLQGTINLANETAVDLFIPDRQVIFRGLYWPITVINPGLNAKGGWTWIDAQTSGEIAGLIAREVRELRNTPAGNDIRRAMRRRFGTITRTKGLNGTGAVNHDISFLRVAKDILNFGRIDFNGDDGYWFHNGITKDGEGAISAMKRSQITLHLINPSRETLSAALASVDEPFLISGYTAFDDSMFSVVKKNRDIIAVDFDPEHVDECISQLEVCRAKLDTTNNLVLNVLATKDLQNAKQELYRGLVAKGWTKDEIYAIGGEGRSWRSDGNFDTLPGGRPRFPGR